MEYHYDGRNRPISLKDAIAQGYTPCDVCKPDSKIYVFVNNEPPIIYENLISLEAKEDETVEMPLYANDPNGDNLSFMIITPPNHGSFNDRFYTPEKDYFGNDNFTYKVNDGTMDSNEGKVSIKINPVNDPPSVNAQSLVIDENTPINIRLTGNDIENDKLTFKIGIQPKNGKLSGETPDLIYEPNYGFGGLDSFTFVVDDGIAISEPAKIEITVKSAPNPFDVNRDGV